MRSSVSAVSVRGTPSRRGLVGLAALCVLCALSGRAFAQAVFVQGLVPDWNQPYFYTPGPGGNGGPGPDPLPGAVNQWNAWCAPTSASNLAGHWADRHGNLNVADSMPFPGSTVNWAVGPSWQDYLGDADPARPAPRNPGAGGPPYVTTDIGWYMDTNRGVPYDSGAGSMGGDDLGNNPHVGTYLKDIHVGLGNHLLQTDPSTPWTTGTQGLAFAAGLAPDGVTPATTHLNPASAFGEVMSEINHSHTMILSYMHWAINSTQFQLMPAGGPGDESFNGGDYYTWGTWSPGQPSTVGDEEWNGEEGGLGLGHAVTAVGYIPAGDFDDVGPQLGLGPTDWVIVHDNWSGTPRNVIIPYNSGGTWVANTNAVPEPGTLVMIAGGVAMLLLRRRTRRA